MYKDAHILFSGKKGETKENAVFPPISSSFFQSPSMHMFFFQRERKSQRMMASEECSYLSFRGLRPFFGVRKDTHVLFFREKRRAKGWWLCKSVDTCFSPSFHLLFSFHPLYLHATAQPFASARFLFSEKKEKPKDDDIGGVYVSALLLLFRLLFSFLPLYMHTSAQPFSSASLLPGWCLDQPRGG